MLKELLYFAWLKKEVPTDYVRKFLYRKDVVAYQQYLSLNQFNSIITSKKLVFPQISNLLDNKLSFYKLCETYKLPIPKVIAYNLRQQFFYKDTNSLRTKKQDLIDFFNNLFETSKRTTLFVKPLSGSGGFGCFLLEKNLLETQIETYGESLLNNCYLYQERIKQHADIDKINSKSINTLRLDTYIDTSNTPHVLSVLMRFGIGNSITDNTHTGGFYIAVSPSGTLQAPGRQDIIEGGGVFVTHPDTHFELNGFQVPFFHEACALAKRLTTYFPNRIIGWDIAITDKGPLVIEGNNNPSLHVTDVAYGGYLKNKHIQNILTEIKK
ncbi:sugar-transfer associated ATP-grasp domain-containing protein [Yeosuana marina]|uniref:sugar-transfer associated ATP-grasp domain-containing protein n=1 Tax=Yeosuana marina TaxID=1565536 RepID=UPI001422308F|nr:sugar-transfer associated ATP-grasp domain-containing protein [Yeosuana marina]